MSYQGPERRVHQIFVTDNTEYHMRGDICVAVRDGKTGQWIEGHTAIGCRLEGGLGRQGGGFLPHKGRPELGDRLAFESDLLTSPLRYVRRPGAETRRFYDGERQAS